MPRTHITEGIRPLSEFRTHAAEFLEQVRATRSPLILTNRGRPMAVLLDIVAYDNLLDELDVLRDVTESDLHAAGAAEPHDRVNARLRTVFGL